MTARREPPTAPAWVPGVFDYVEAERMAGRALRAARMTAHVTTDADLATMREVAAGLRLQHGRAFAALFAEALEGRARAEVERGRPGAARAAALAAVARKAADVPEWPPLPPQGPEPQEGAREPRRRPTLPPAVAERRREAWRAAAVERRLAAANAANATRRARAEIDADARGGDR